MNLVVFSHKECWLSHQTDSKWATDGGFSIQMDYLSRLFDKVTIWVPVVSSRLNGQVPFTSSKIILNPIYFNFSRGVLRKILVLLWTIFNFYTIWKEVKRHDAVHIPIPSDIGTIGIWIALLQHKPLFIRYCGNIASLQTIMEKYWYSLMNKISGGKNVVFITGGGKCKPIPTNSNIDWIFSTSFSNFDLSTLNVNRNEIFHKDTLIIGFLGRIEKGKRIDILLDSHKKLKLLAVNKKIQIHIAGEGSLLSDYKSIYSDPDIKFLGKLNRVQVLQFLKSIDLFVFPSISEGFPKSVLEAMACALPVITSNVSVLPFLVKDTSSGIVLDNIDSASIVEAVKLILFNPDLYFEMSNNAVNVSKKYSLERWVSEINSKLVNAWGIK